MKPFTRLTAQVNMVYYALCVVMGIVIILLGGASLFGAQYHFMGQEVTGRHATQTLGIFLSAGGFGYILIWRALLHERMWAWSVLTILLGLTVASHVILSLVAISNGRQWSVQLPADPIYLLSLIVLLTDPPAKWFSESPGDAAAS